MVTQNSCSDGFTRRVGGLVENAKRNTQWRQQFMEWDREMACMRAKGREEGRKEGARQNALEAAQNLYANGVSVDIIAKSLNMTEDQVKEIVCEIALAAN
ncbi:MAG: hypothetical protein J6X95_05300 [Treponema sp.]|nr:hypothetical protein [Treponema sp.]